MSGNRLGLAAGESGHGRLLGAGGILLAAAIFMINLRLSDQWSHGVHLLVALAAFALVFGLGVLAGVPGERPWAYQSALLVTGLVLLVVVLPRFAQVVGVDDLGDTGPLLWMSAIFTLVAAVAALRYRSAACALFGALGVAAFVLSAADQIADHPQLTTFRWILFLLALCFAVGAAVLRGMRGPLHGAQLVNASGIALLGLGFTFVAGGYLGSFTSLSVDAPGGGWKLVLVVGSLAILAYAIWDGARGPGYVGGVALLTAVVAVGRPKFTGEGSIVGWPLVLLVLAAVAFGVGLRARGDQPGPPPTS